MTLLDRIVAVVNNEVITRGDLDERYRFASQQLQQQGTPLPPRDVLEKQMLERLITDHVQLQLAKETGLRVDDSELDRAISRIAQDNKLTLPQLRAALEKDGVPFARFREDIRNEIILSRLREREVDNKIVVSDRRDRQFHQRPESQAGRGERIQPLPHPGDGAGERQPGTDPGTPRPRRAGAPAARGRAPTSARSRRRSPTRPTRCRAARWAGAMARACRRCSSMPLKSLQPAR